MLRKLLTATVMVASASLMSGCFLFGGGNNDKDELCSTVQDVWRTDLNASQYGSAGKNADLSGDGFMAGLTLL